MKIASLLELVRVMAFNAIFNYICIFKLYRIRIGDLIQLNVTL